LPGLRAMGVARIASDKYARLALTHQLLRYIIELVCQALADFIDRPPHDVLHFEAVRLHDPLRGSDQLVDGDGPIRDPLAGGQLVHLDIKTREKTTLPRDADDVAFIRRLDERLAADIRELRARKHIHNAPSLVRRIAKQFPPDRL